MTAPGRALVHPKIDGWLLGGIGVVAWLVVSPIGFGDSLAPISGVLAWAIAGVTAAHFGSSYHLAYGKGWAAVKRNPVALGAIPVLLLLTSIGVAWAHIAGAEAGAQAAIRVMFISVFTLTGWHYIKQAYGVALLAGRTHGVKPQRREALLLRYSLYPVWIASIVEIYGQGRGATYRSVDITVSLIPPLVGKALTTIAVAGLAVAAVTMIRMARRASTIPPLGMWGSYAAGGLWLLLPPSYIGAAVMVAGLHALQYVACVHRAEVDWATERGERHIPTLWLSIFGGAAAGGLLVASWLPPLLDRSVAAGSVGVYGSLLFVILNLHHYAIDATVWRSGGDHVTRISRGPQTQPQPQPETTAPSPQPALA
ncbi:MAG: hypothetical protein ABIP03_02675 [Aquihabitans sp.]